MSAILHRPLGDGFTEEDIEVAIRNMSPSEQKMFLDLNRLNKADHLVAKIREMEIRKELIDGVWRDVAGPMLLLRGLYRPGGKHEALTLTENYQWMSQGRRAKEPFPYRPHGSGNADALRPGWDYVDWLFHYLLLHLKSASNVENKTEEKPHLLVPKSREMMTSWSVCGFIFWHCEMFEATGWIGQSEKDDKAMGLVKYVNILYENQPDYLKARFPLKNNRESGTGHRIDWFHKSWFKAVPQGERQLASDHPHGYFSDEAAHQPLWSSCVDIARPAVRQLVSVSSAADSAFMNQCER